MSDKNVELVRRLFEAGYQRDSATVFALYDTAVVWDVSRLGVADFGAGVYHGHDGIRDWFREWYAAMAEATRNASDELIDAGESVLSVQPPSRRRAARPAASDGPHLDAVRRVEDPWQQVVRADWFLDARKRSVVVFGPAHGPHATWTTSGCLSDNGRRATPAWTIVTWDGGSCSSAVAVAFDAAPYSNAGLADVASFMREFLQPWTNFTITAEDFIEAGDSVVVVARRAGSGGRAG